MSRSRSLLPIIVAIALSSVTLGTMPLSAQCKSVSNSDDEVRQSAEMAEQGNLPEAIVRAQAIIKEHPTASKPHALLSYLMWREGNLVSAVEEGETAIKLAPDSLPALTNLSRMKDAVSDCNEAIRLYEKLSALAPDDCQGQLGTARCYIKLGKPDVARATLESMIGQSGKSFKWYYEIGDGCLQFDQPGLAAEASRKALQVATTQQERSDSTTQLMLALLRDNKLDQARAMMDQVFSTCQPSEYELYVRAAVLLLPAVDPGSQSAKYLMDCAVKNLTNSNDAEGFYRLGRAFENKAGYVSYDSNKVKAWLNYAGIAHARAVELDPMQARYYLALAGILTSQGKVDTAAGAFKKAQVLDPNGVIEPFFLDRLNSSKLNLTCVRFVVKGLNCSCHASRIESLLAKYKGVAFVGISHQEPPEGMLIVESPVKVDDLFRECANEWQNGPKLKVEETLSFDVRSKQQVAGAEDAVRLVQNMLMGDELQFYNQLRVADPVLPIDATGAAISQR